MNTSMSVFFVAFYASVSCLRPFKTSQMLGFSCLLEAAYCWSYPGLSRITVAQVRLNHLSLNTAWFFCSQREIDQTLISYIWVYLVSFLLQIHQFSQYCWNWNSLKLRVFIFCLFLLVCISFLLFVSLWLVMEKRVH